MRSLPSITKVPLMCNTSCSIWYAEYCFLSCFQYRLSHPQGQARHGEGQHNVAESLYGTKAWEASPSIKARYPGHIPTEYQNHWAKLDGNGTLIWSDAHLTAKGEAQARSANAFWANCIHTQHIPLPQMYYSSPLTRCLATASITFSDLPLPPDRPFKPIVKELLRETNGVHTCDRRSSKSYLTAKFPGFTIELGFSEEDELWNSEVRENSSEQDARMRVFLDDLFEHDESTYISLSAHSGTIASLLRVLGHRIFRLPTGAIIPVLVKVERICVND